MANSLSKPIGKSDDSSKEFIIDCLAGNSTGGFDIDSIYYVDSVWYVFEYLKVENPYVTPHSSHPRRYPWNWRKFYSLWNLTQKLAGKLFLINYSDRKQDSNEVKVMEVEDFDLKKIQDFMSDYKQGNYCDYMKLKERNMTKKEFSEYLIELNNRALKSSI